MQNKTILIVDDEPHIRYMLEFKLSRAGYDVLEAADGRQAFELATDHRPDLIITDFQMPGGDGLQLARRLKDDPGTEVTPVILLTARGHRVSQEALEPTNVKQIVAKPFGPGDLLSLVEQLLTKSTPERCAQ